MGAKRFQPPPSALLFGVVVLLCACPRPDPDDPLPDEHECAAVWGSAPAEGRIHVDVAVEPGGDGSLAAPYSTLMTDGSEVDSGLEAARQSGVRQIVLAPGEYPGSYRLSGSDPAWQDSGLEIAGCGSDRTSLTAISAYDESGAGPFLQPNLQVVGPETYDIAIRDLSLTGGWRGLVVRTAAGAAGPIVIERVTVVEPVRIGVLVDGKDTRARLVDVEVRDVDPSGGLGWGISVQTRASQVDEVPGPTVLEGVTVSGATEVGILADGAWVEMTAVSVSDTAPGADGLYGRGVQLQNLTRGALDDVTLQGNSDAALFLHKPGWRDEAIEVTGGLLGSTVPATAGDDATGDGLVITQANTGVAVEEFLAVIDGVEFGDNPRSHLLAEGVVVQVGPDNVFGKGTDFPFASQGGALVEGIGGGEPGEPPTELSAAEALDIERESLGLDELTE
jgi:hypothetical protein